MKKIITTIACLLLASTFSFAKDESRFGAGVKAAFDYGRMYGFEDEDDDMEGVPQGIGYEAGLMLRVKLIPNLFFSTEVNYNYIKTSHKAYDKERSYTASDLEIPLLLRGVIADKFYFTAGPQINLNLSNDSDIPVFNKNSLGIQIADIESTEQAFFTVGLSAGAGYNIIGGLNVDLRFFMGFMELFPDVMTPLEYAQSSNKDDAHVTMISMHGAKMMKFKVGVSYWFM